MTHLLPIASASSIQYLDGKTYVIGDDSPFVLVITGDDYANGKQVSLINRPEKRIPKPEKPDFESSALVYEEDAPHLLIIGSASTPQREQMILLPVNSPDKYQVFSSNVFLNRVKQLGFSELNIEAAVAIPGTGKLILADRGHQGNRTNKIIITSTDFYKRQDVAPITIAEIMIPDNEFHKGISGFAYIPERDLLLFTASAEDTPNSYDDGTVIGSYIGWIENISTKLNQPEITPNAFYDLKEFEDAFAAQKIESLCVRNMEADQQHFNLLLVADNDKDDTSELFKLTVHIPL